MNWHYVEQEQQVGPVSDEQLAQLVQKGKINGDTLVWREGLADWIPYREINPAPAAPPSELKLATPPVTSPIAEDVTCAECGKQFPIGETIRHGTIHICAGCKPVFMQKLAEGAHLNTGELNYARVLARFAAIFLDGVMLWIVNFSIGQLIRLTFLDGTHESSTAILVRFTALLINIVIAMTYEAVLIGKYGATLGKMACRIKVVTADGGKVGYGRSFGRYFAKWLNCFTLFIGYFIAIFDSQKRALHDHICNTRVVVN